MNDKYFIGRATRQIENINNNLMELRKYRDDINEKIENDVCVRELLKKSLKRFTKN